MQRIAILASGRGSNASAIITACVQQQIPAVVTIVISNRKNAAVLDIAAQAGIATQVLANADYRDAAQHDRILCTTLTQLQIDWVVLAGYLQPIGKQVLHQFRGRTVNIHPSLLPRHGGRGMYGIRVHQAVLAAGDTETGASVHLVEEEYDSGRILAQQRVAVLAEDTPESLAQRVLQAEHQLYPQTLARLCRQREGIPADA